VRELAPDGLRARTGELRETFDCQGSSTQGNLNAEIGSEDPCAVEGRRHRQGALDIAMGASVVDQGALS
jgi:hypothetical protein